MAKRSIGSVTRIRDGVWQVRVTVRGERKSLGTTATREEGLALAEAYGERAGDVRGMTLNAFGAKWMDRRETDGYHRQVHKDRSRWRTWISKAPFAEMRLHRISRPQVVKWVRSLMSAESPKTGETISRQTVINVLSLLRACLSDALQEGLVDENMAAQVKVPKAPRDRESWTYLTAEEIHAVETCEAMPEANRIIFTAAIYTGLRAGELWGLRWQDVHLDEERPYLHVCRSYLGPTKSGKPREVPLLRPARQALWSWRELRPGIGPALVFPSSSGGTRAEGYDAGWSDHREKSLTRLGLKRAAGILRPVRFHDLRHTCASHLAMGTWGRPWKLDEVRALLGHSTVTVTERYAHLSPDSIHEAARETIGYKSVTTDNPRSPSKPRNR